MKKMMMILCVITLAVGSVFAQSNKVTGTMKIKFNGRTEVDDAGNPIMGVKNVYSLDIMSTGLLCFQGNVEELPGIYSGGFGTEKQGWQVSYNLQASIVNPANPQQKKAVGKFVGTVPIDKKGVYQYGRGTLRMAIDAAGSASQFESKFSGTAAGRPPKTGSVIEKIKKQAVTLTRQAKGKMVRIVVTDYDKMDYSDVVLSAGPVKSYPETHVNGQMLYDYERSAWYFNGVTLSYRMAGKDVTDKLSGNIKWVEDPQRKSNGLAEYQFDVRVNEPEKDNETAVFKGGDDEAAFFAVDSTLAALTGTAKYKDQLKDGIPMTSDVVYDLTGNCLTKQQIVALTKLILFVNIIPFSAE